MTWCLTSTETIRLSRDGEKGGGGGGGAGRVQRWRKTDILDYIYLSLHCHRQNDSCALRSAATRAVLVFH